MRRTIEIPVFRDPHGTPVRARIAWRMTDLSGRPIMGIDADGDPIVDYREILSGDEPTTIELTTTDTVSPPSQYRLDIATPLGRTRHIVQIESGETELTWAEMIALPAGVASGEILSNRLLPDPTGQPDGYTAVVENEQWVATNESPVLALAATSLQSDQATADGLAILGATLEEQKAILGIPRDMILGPVADDGNNMIFGAVNA